MRFKLVPGMTAKILLSLIAALTISTHCCYSAPLSATKNNQSALSLSSNTGGALSDMIDEQAALSKLLINKLDNGTSRVEFTFGARKNFIVGNYTNFGNQLDVNGLLVKVHPMRACQRKTLGLDSTLAGHIVVVIMDGYVEPFLAGCISPYNQARFARDSLAIGVLFDVQRMRSNSKQKKTEDPPLDIPVVAIGGLQAQSMRAILQRAHKEGHAMEVTIKRNIMEKEQTVKPEDQVKWKINLKPRRTQEDVSLQSLAKCALAKMEIKKYRTNKKPKLSMKRKQDGLLLQQQQLPNAECHLASISLLGSSKRSLSRSTESDTCAVCLEDFRNGQVLRVILCGHEFHKKCVDPWLLQNRTCPLCLFDVVFEKYVGAARSPEDCPATVEQLNAANPNSNIVSSSSVAGNLGRSTAVVGVLENPVDPATAIHRRSVSEQFWQIGFWEGFGEKRALDFVPRRAGVLDNQNCYCSNSRLSSAIPINNCAGVQQRNGENNLPEPAGNPNNDMMTSQFSSTRSICCASCVNFDARHRTRAAPIFVKKPTVKQRKRKFQQNSAAVKRLPRRYYANCDCHVTTNGVGSANKRCRHSSKNVQHNKQLLSLDQTFIVDNIQISEGYLSDVSSSLTVTTVKENLHNANVANDNRRTGDKDGCNLSSCESSRS